MNRLSGYNKATGTVVAGAIMAVVTNFYPEMFNSDAVIGIQSLVSLLFVWAATNR